MDRAPSVGRGAARHKAPSVGGGLIVPCLRLLSRTMSTVAVARLRGCTHAVRGACAPRARRWRRTAGGSARATAADSLVRRIIQAKDAYVPACLPEPSADKGEARSDDAGSRPLPPLPADQPIRAALAAHDLFAAQAHALAAAAETIARAKRAGTVIPPSGWRPADAAEVSE